MMGGSSGLRELAAAWYGVIPDSWGAEKFKHLATIRNGQVDPEDSRFRELPLFAPNHIESGTGRILGVESADEQGAESGKYLVRKGEIVYSKIRPALRKAALAPCDGLCSADMYPIAPRRHVNARFLLYVMLSEGFSRYALLESDRVAMPKINREALGECPFVLPYLDQQRAIAAFLDRKTAAIDALIAKKERQVELLQEKRQALITQAVTKGLDPNVPMKDSGVPWMGTVPAHWLLTRMKFVKARSKNAFVDGPFGSNLKSIHFVPDGEIYVIESGFATTGRLDPTRLKRISAEHFETILRSETKANDIIIAKIGAQYGLSSVLPLLDRRAVVSGNSMKLTIDPVKVVNGYAHAFLLCLKWSGALAQVANVTAQPALSLGEMNGLPWCLPPRSEQEAIIEHLEQENIRSDSIVEKVMVQLDRLHEYRQALISAAVTGKIETPAEEAA